MAYRLRDEPLVLSSRNHLYYTRKINASDAKIDTFTPGIGGTLHTADNILLSNVSGTSFVYHPRNTMVMMGLSADYEIPYKNCFVYGSAFGYMPSNFETPPSISIQINANLAYGISADQLNPPTLFVPCVFGGIDYTATGGHVEFELNLLTCPTYHANTVKLSSGSWIEHINLSVHVLPDRQYDYIVLGVMHFAASSVVGRTADSIIKFQRNTNINSMLHINDAIVPMYDPAS